jgi:hypothetical protein
MRTYSTADTMICSEQEQESSPFEMTPDDESVTFRRPGGKIVRNYQKIVRALTKTVNSFELSRQIYG